MSFGFMPGGGIMMWIFWIALFALLWFLFKGYLRDGDKPLSAAELLERRLARGEITPEEYRRMKDALDGKD